MNSYPKSLRAALACLLVGAVATSARAQIGVTTQLFPMVSTAGLTDLNDVILFRSNHLGVQAFDGAVNPNEYMVGPGDKIEVNVWTPSARTFLLTITPEGTLLVPAVGELHISGKSLAEARTAILDATSASFPGSEISATLINARRVRVYVSGLVSSPGTYELSANQRLGDAIARAGDVLAETGSARNIRVQTSPDSKSFDLLKFYAQGDMEQNPYLQGGDHIQVLPREPETDQLRIAGAVLRPGRIEFRTGDRVSDLIKFAHGFLPRADLSRIIISGVDPTTGMATSRTVVAPVEERASVLDPDLELVRGDQVYVSFQPSRIRTATVAIYGDVMRPGHYVTVDGETMLSELLETAGGILPTASPHEVVFLRNAFSTNGAPDAMPPLLSIDLAALLAGDATFDIALRDQDSLFIPQTSPGIQVVGRVRRPGILTYAPNQPVNYYLERAGGFGFQADKGKVRIVRAVSGAEEKPGGASPPEPGDRILIPAKAPWSTGQKVRNLLTILGAVATTYLAVENIVNK